MGLISSYSDDAATTDNDRFLTYAADGTTKNTPASNINKYLGDGWIISGDTWTFSSYNSTTKVGVINANSGANTKYNVGMWIKFTQPTLGLKYAVVVSTTTSTITAKFTGTTILSNEAITSPYFSATANPFGTSLIQPEQMANRFYASSFTFANATGTQTITGVGFTPRAILVQGTGRTSTVEAHTTTGFCFYNGSTYTQQSTGIYSASGVWNSQTASAAINAANAVGGVLFSATVTGFSADTVTFNVTTSAADAGFRTYLIFVLG